MFKYKTNYKIDFDSLPHRGKSGKFLKWDDMIGKKVNFLDSDNKEDYFLITNIVPNPTKNRLKIYTDYHGYNSHITQGNFLLSQISVVIGRKKFGYKYNVGDVIDSRIQILDRESIKMGINKYHRYKYECKICGNVDFVAEQTKKKKKIICNVCKGFKVRIGFNDIPTVEPWMVKYFQGGYEEAKKYTCNSNKKIFFKCPDCNRVKKNKISILQLHQRKSIGCSCGDGYSYPNKFMFKLLEQIGIEFINEYSPEWISPKRYDFYIPSKKMIVEMDGGIGHGKTGYLLDPEKTKNIDKYKDSKAIEHGLNIIRIDASKSNKEYISRKILESKIFSENELSNVDFDKCDEFTCINPLKYTCEEYEKLKPISCHDLSKILKMSFSTTLCYLNRGKELNICSYNGSQYMSNLHCLHIRQYCYDKA